MARKRSSKGQFVKGLPRTKKGASDAIEQAVKRHKRRKRRSNPEGTGSELVTGTANPPPLQDLVEFILPGFVGYGATKFISRMTYTQLSKRFPNGGKHLAAGSTLATAALAWFLVHRIKKIAKYHTPVVVGSSIAALQTLIQTYVPKYGWLVSDLQPEPKLSVIGAAQAPMELDVERLFPGGPEIVAEDAETLSDNGSASSAVDDIDIESLGLGSLGSGGATEQFSVN